MAFERNLQLIPYALTPGLRHGARVPADSIYRETLWCVTPREPELYRPPPGR